MIANAATTADGISTVLAVLPIQDRATASIRLGSADGPALDFLDLPYAIPEPL